MTGDLEILVRLLHEDAVLPQRWTAGSAAFDIYARLISESHRPNKSMLPPRTTRFVSTGIAVEPPSGYMVTVWSCPALALKSVMVTNSPMLVGYHSGEIIVPLYNGGLDPYYVQHGERIGQLVLMPALFANCIPVKE